MFAYIGDGSFTYFDKALTLTDPVNGVATFTASAARTFAGTMQLTGVHVGAAVADLNELVCDFTFKGLVALN